MRRTIGLWAVAVWALPASGVGALGWAALAPQGGAIPGARVAARPSEGARGAYRADTLAERVVRRDPFRADRRPAAVVYDPLRAGAPVVPERPPKPALVLTGIVWGRVPQAVLEGLPGTSEPRVVRTGDAIGELRIRRISRDRVVVAGMDTLWTLSVREPWQ